MHSNPSLLHHMCPVSDVMINRSAYSGVAAASNISYSSLSHLEYVALQRKKDQKFIVSFL